MEDLRTLEIHNHDIVTSCIVQDVAWLRIMVENAQLVQRLVYRGDLIDDARHVDIVNALKQGLPSPAEKHEMHVNTTVVVVWQD